MVDDAGTGRRNGYDGRVVGVMGVVGRRVRWGDAWGYVW